ncbi:MAG: hypothetical protein QM296_01495 [Bacillota bacterium]|nr:hypothetical protein [Bacillota bacterium]
MTNREALEILGLGTKANSYEIEARYGRLIKGYAKREDEEGKAQLERINAAYRHLKGDNKPFVPPKASDSRVVFGKTVYQWRNIIDYGWKPFIAISLAVGLVIAIVVTAINNDPPDLQVAAIGAFADVGHARLQKDQEIESLGKYAARIENVDKPVFEMLTIGGNIDREIEMAAITKRMIYATGSQQTDLMLLDQVHVDLFFEEGFFDPLDDYWERLVAAHGEERVRKVFEPVRMAPPPPSVDTDQATAGGAAEPGGENPIYIFDATESGIFEAFGIYGMEVYVLKPSFSGEEDLGYALLDRIVAQQDELFERIRVREEAARATTDQATERKQTEASAADSQAAP